MEGEKREDRRLPLPLFYPPYFPKLHAYQTPLGKLLVTVPENFMHRSSPLWIELQFFTDIYPLFIPFRREQGRETDGREEGRIAKKKNFSNTSVRWAECSGMEKKYGKIRRRRRRRRRVSGGKVEFVNEARHFGRRGKT